MNERDERALRAGAWRWIDQLRAARPELRERGMDVIDAQRDVMQAWSARLQILRDRRIWRGRLQQLQTRFADRHEMRAHALRRDLFRRLDLEAERVAIERQRGRQVANGDADMVENSFHTTGCFSRRDEER